MEVQWHDTYHIKKTVMSCGACMAMAKRDQSAMYRAIQGMTQRPAVRNTIMGTLAITVRYSLDTYSNTGRQSEKCLALRQWGVLNED